MISHAGLSDRITILHGSLADLLPTLQDLPLFDFVFIDHNKSVYVSVSCVLGIILLLQGGMRVLGC